MHEISCNPKFLSNNFEKDSLLPREITPAFFRAEVLSKYKRKPNKYKLFPRSIRCRNSWELRTFDVNEHKQVHTYLRYLRDLPYEEQKHWKSFNEAPKGGISKRVFQTDIKGEFSDIQYPSEKIVEFLKQFNKDNLGWWKVKSEKLFFRVHPPYEDTDDDWEFEIINLHKLIVEGFNKKLFTKMLDDKGEKPKPKWNSLILIEEVLIAIGFEKNQAEDLISPFNHLNLIRNKLQHVEEEAVKKLKKDVLKKYKSYLKHFEGLCTECHESLVILKDAFESDNDSTKDEV